MVRFGWTARQLGEFLSREAMRWLIRARLPRCLVSVQRLLDRRAPIHRHFLFYVGRYRVEKYRHLIQQAVEAGNVDLGLGRWALAQLCVRKLAQVDNLPLERASSADALRTSYTNYSIEYGTNVLSSEDISSLCSTLEGTSGRVISREQMGRYLNRFSGNHRLVAVLRFRGEAVGLLTAYCDRLRPAYIEEIFISKKHRGRGLGNLLLTVASDYMRGLRVHRIGLAVMIDNIGAQRFFEREGFSFCALGQKEFLMEKRLRRVSCRSLGFMSYKRYMVSHVGD